MIRSTVFLRIWNRAYEVLCGYADPFGVSNMMPIILLSNKILILCIIYHCRVILPSMYLSVTIATNFSFCSWLMQSHSQNRSKLLRVDVPRLVSAGNWKPFMLPEQCTSEESCRAYQFSITKKTFFSAVIENCLFSFLLVCLCSRHWFFSAQMLQAIKIARWDKVHHSETNCIAYVAQRPAKTS